MVGVHISGTFRVGSEALTGGPEAGKEEATASCGEGQRPVLAAATSRIPPGRPTMAAPPQETLSRLS